MNYHLSPKSELSKYLVDNIKQRDNLVLAIQSDFRYCEDLNLAAQILIVEEVDSTWGNKSSYDFCITYNLFNRLKNSDKPYQLRSNAILYVSNIEYQLWLRDYKIGLISET
jgi:hypothetical protein